VIAFQRRFGRYDRRSPTANAAKLVRAQPRPVPLLDGVLDFPNVSTNHYGYSAGDYGQLMSGI
jgi:hypothetical protein